MTFHFLKFLNTRQSSSVETSVDLWPCGQKRVVMMVLLKYSWDEVYNLTATDSVLNIYFSPLIQSLTPCFSVTAEQPEDKSQHNRREGRRAGRGTPRGRECWCDGKSLRSVGMFKSLPLQPVQSAYHRTEDQPDNSAAGGNLFSNYQQKCDNDAFMLHSTFPKHTLNQKVNKIKKAK